jgi:adenosylcobinamide-phosphate synthase
MYLPAASCALALLLSPLVRRRSVSEGPLLGQITRQIVTGYEKKLNRSQREGYIRESRGAILIVLLLLIATLPVLFSYGLTRFARVPEWFADGMLLSCCLYTPHNFRRLRIGLRYAGKSKEAELRQQLLPLFRHDGTAADEHRVLRSLLEEAAETFADRVLSPLCWFLLGGLFAAFAQQLIHYADAHVGHTSKKYRAFGKPVAIMDSWFNYLPARFSILFLGLAAFFVPRAKAFTALLMPLRQARKLTSFNSGWPISSLAGALGVALGGPRNSGGSYYDEEWIGKGSARPTRLALKQAMQLLFAAHLLLLALLLLVSDVSMLTAYLQ